VESMSRVPMGSDLGSDHTFSDEFKASFPYEIVHQGQSAEMLAEKWNLSRAALDEFAASSHCKAAAAQRNCWTSREIFHFDNLKADEGVRDNPDRVRMAALKPVFKADGVITAANSSQISDGAAAVLLSSGAKADEL